MNEKKKAHIEQVPISKIEVPDVRADAEFTEEQKEIFEASAEKYGIISDIILRKMDGDKYELLDGKHRLEELKDQGKTKVQAKVFEADEKNGMMMHLIMDQARGEQNPVDVGEVFEKYLNSGGTIEEIAEITGHTKDWVTLRRAAARAPDWVKEALRKGHLRIGHLKWALKLPNPREQKRALEMALKANYKVKTLKNYYKRRMREIREKRARGEGEKPIEPPSKEEMRHKAETKMCMTCKRAVETENVNLIRTCDQCYKLVRWLIDQIGPPQKVQEYVFNAVRLYQSIESKKQLREEMPSLQPERPQKPSRRQKEPAEESTQEKQSRRKSASEDEFREL